MSNSRQHNGSSTAAPTAKTDSDRLAERLEHTVRSLQSARAESLRREDELTALRALNKDLERENAALLNSLSWRATAPLRTVSAAVRNMGAVPRAGLRGLNRLSMTVHGQIKRRNPALADAISHRVKPLISRANMMIFGQQGVWLLPPSRAAQSTRYDFQREEDWAEFTPLVSVIVPNYNHGRYLAKRLDSILAQTYPNIEILLLDDCSTDDSRAVLNDYAARHPDKIRTLFNDENSGGVFYQWQKGIKEARGDLIWIAESDDWASENFLETLVPYFQNEAIMLAYARTIFMDGEGENEIWSMEGYLNAFGPERWGKPWVATAHDIVHDVFSMTNIVPNVSSALFRRFDRMDVLEMDQWRGMRTCGDWMFYLNAIRGGMMAYSPEAQNYYRIHDSNTSVTSHKGDQFYEEHETVARCLRRHYRFPDKNLLRMDHNLREHWRITRDDYSDDAFKRCFDIDRVRAAPMRKPAVLMVGYAFCAGGGETFPIQLANELKSIGHDVTFLDCAQEDRVPDVRDMLASDIPIISDFADLQRMTERFDIDIVHSHHGWVDNVILDLLPPDAKTRTAVTLHGFYETVPDEMKRQILPRLIDRTDALIYTARKNLDAIRQLGLEETRPLHRIDNALSRTESTPIDRAALGIAPGAFVLTLVARALFTKGWLEAVTAVTRARELSGKDIHLILIGEGEAKDELDQKGVPDHVHLEGFRGNIRDYFAASDLGFLPSRFRGESFPLVIIDSLNVGTPVLASDIGEIRYMLTTDDGCAGALFALDDNWQIDTEALAGLIAELANDPDQLARLRTQVPKAAEAFDPRRMAERYSAIYAGSSEAPDQAGKSRQLSKRLR